MARHYAKAAGALSVGLVLAKRARDGSRRPQPCAPTAPPTPAPRPTCTAAPHPEPVPPVPPAIALAAAAAEPFWFEPDPEPQPTPEQTEAPEPEPEPEPGPEPEPTPEPQPTHAPEPEPHAPAPATAAARQRPALEPAPIWGWAESWSFELDDSSDGRRTRHRGRSHRRLRHTGRRRPSHPVRARRAALLGLMIFACVGGGALTLRHSTPAGARPQRAPGVRPQPSADAVRAIPASYLHLYWRAAREYGLDWTKLAAVGQIESDHGRSSEPGVRSGTNHAGAVGPAQFLAHTWARYGVDADGRGKMDPYDPADAITAMAAYLKASGAPEDWHNALYTYNHSERYVRSVLELSVRFGG